MGALFEFSQHDVKSAAHLLIKDRDQSHAELFPPVGMSIDYAVPNSAYLREPDSIGLSEWVDRSSATINSLNRHHEELFYDLMIRRLLPLLIDESIEPGYVSRADVVFEELIAVNRLAALSAINVLYLRYFAQARIAAQIVMLIGRQRHSDVESFGVTMATAALSSKYVEMIEAGIRCFENWGVSKYAPFLQAARLPSGWLAQYRDRVVVDISGGGDAVTRAQGAAE